MPDPNTALGKRNLLDALDDRPVRKWYRAQYVDIAIQTDFALAEDAPTNSLNGTVSVADVNGTVSRTTPKILITSTTTSSDSPTVGSSPVPRGCIEQRIDVAPFTASPKDSAPTLIVSPSRAASHMKAAETFAPALSAPVLAMSSSEWIPSTAVTNIVGKATSAVPLLNVSTSAPVSLPSATCTPSHDGVHNAPVLTSRLSGPTLTWTMLAVSSEFSHSDHDVRSDTFPSSFISGPTLATPSTPTTHSSRSPPHGEEKPFPVPPASESLDRMNRPRRIWGKEPHHDSDERFLTNSPNPKRLGMKITPGQLPSASLEPGPSEQAEVAFKRRTRRAGKQNREKKEKYRMKQLQLELSSSESKVDMPEEQPESQRP
ncbi:hypothetical protein EXIGLDRAFT_835161 [Exidia glandulosa HHB12029]|uniref:Uncharacterized protein n=1 Tax=Exidia glandulosa HHB12029 TaxID=1314781 RepID=A0A166AQI3_EXIGL|nr:hypothetical protein EXIGLDRAFT_835161 [Exidia glandulosa HHB12029]